MSIGFGNNIIFFIVSCLISMALVSLYISNENINRIKIADVEVPDLYADEESVIKIFIENHKTRDSFSLEFFYENENDVKVLPLVKANSKTQVEVRIKPFSRGKNTLPRLTLRSYFPFGLTRPWCLYHFKKDIVVFPAKKGSPNLPQNDGSLDLRQNAGMFRDLKDFSSSDSVRRVDWRRSQKHQKILVRTFEESEDKNIHIDIIKCASIEKFEDQLSQLSLWVSLAEKNDYSYSFRMGQFSVNRGQGRDHFLSIMNHLGLVREPIGKTR